MSEKDAGINTNLVEEWKILRDEITRKQNFVEHLIITTVAGDFAIFSFAFSLQDLAPISAFVALLPMVVTTISYLWILRYLVSGFRISLYIKERIEPMAGTGWETWLSSLRKRMSPGGKMRFGSDVFAVFFHFIYGFSLLVTVLLIWAHHWSSAISGTTQSPNVAPGTSIALTVGAVLFGGIWYLIARYLFIARARKDIQELIAEMQKAGA